MGANLYNSRIHQFDFIRFMILAASVSGKTKRIPKSTQGGSFHSSIEIAEKRLLELDESIAPILDRMNSSPILSPYPRFTGKLIKRITQAILDVLWNNEKYSCIIPNKRFYVPLRDLQDSQYLTYQIFHQTINSISDIVFLSDMVSLEGEYYSWSIGIFWVNNMIDIHCSKDWFSSNTVFVLTIQKIQGIINTLVNISKNGIKMDEMSYKASQFFEQNQKLQEENHELRKKVSTDRLTKIPNRLAMEEQFEQIPKDADSICLLILDIDNFKNVNTTYGHNGWDRALISFASILTIALRHFGDPENFKKSEFFRKSEYFKSPENILGYERSFNINNQKQKYDIDGYYPDFSVHRLWGEEFVIILNGVNPLLANVFAEFVRSEIEATTVPMPRNMIDPNSPKFKEISLAKSQNLDLADSEFVALNITASIGLAQLQPWQALTDLLGNADKALYYAKHNGKNQVIEFWSETMSPQWVPNSSVSWQLPKWRRKGERWAIPGKIVYWDNLIERRVQSRRWTWNRTGRIVHSLDELGSLYGTQAA